MRVKPIPVSVRCWVVAAMVGLIMEVYSTSSSAANCVVVAPVNVIVGIVEELTAPKTVAG